MEKEYNKNHMILGREINDIPFVEKNGEKLYYYKDNEIIIYGKITNEFLLFIAKENGDEEYVFDFNKGNPLANFVDVDKKALVKMADEMKAEIIKRLNISVKEVKNKKGFLKW